MSVEMKIKSKSLEAEAKIIRFEEKKQIKMTRWYRGRQDPENAMESYLKHGSLQSHRKWDVRNEARATFLARAYMRGDTYNSVEHKVKDSWKLHYYVLPRVIAMVAKYGRPVEKTEEIREKLKKWLTS